MDTDAEFDGLKDEDILYASQEKPALFRVIVARYEKPFLRKAKSIVRGDEDAEDVVQDAFTKIYFHAGKFKKMPGIEFKSWAYKILVNTSINKYHWLKKRPKAEFIDEMMYEKVSESSESIVLAADAKMAVESALSRLPVESQKLLTFYYLEDKSYKDIANKENMTIPALKMKLFRAKRMLKKAMNDNLYEQ